MNIIEDFQKAFAESGWSQVQWEEATGVSQPVISKLLASPDKKTSKKGLHSSTIQKLWPYLYGDKRPSPTAPQGAQQ